MDVFLGGILKKIAGGHFKQNGGGAFWAIVLLECQNSTGTNILPKISCQVPPTLANFSHFKEGKGELSVCNIGTIQFFRIKKGEEQNNNMISSVHFFLLENRLQL